MSRRRTQPVSSMLMPTAKQRSAGHETDLVESLLFIQKVVFEETEEKWQKYRETKPK